MNNVNVDSLKQIQGLTTHDILSPWLCYKWVKYETVSKLQVSSKASLLCVRDRHQSEVFDGCYLRNNHGRIQGESKRTGPSENKLLKIDAIQFLPNEYSGIYVWVSGLILWKPHCDCFIQTQDMLISTKTS